MVTYILCFIDQQVKANVFPALDMKKIFALLHRMKKEIFIWLQNISNISGNPR